MIRLAFGCLFAQLGWTRWELGRKQLVIGPRRLGLGLRLEAIDPRLLEPGLRQLGLDLRRLGVDLRRLEPDLRRLGVDLRRLGPDLRRLVLGPRLAELDPIQLATDCLTEGVGWKQSPAGCSLEVLGQRMVLVKNLQHRTLLELQINVISCKMI